MSTMSFTAAELNYLIYRYLQDSGMKHTAFMMACEANLNQAKVSGADVPAGALVDIIQKGLAFAEFEARGSTSAAAADSGDAMDAENAPLGLIEAVTEDPAVKQRAKERLMGNASSSADQPGTSSGGTAAQRERDREARAERSQNGGGNGGPAPAANQRRGGAAAAASPAMASPSSVGRGPGAPSVPPDRPPPSTPNGIIGKKQMASNGMFPKNQDVDMDNSETEIERSKVKSMKLHKSEVFICAWNPKVDIIGTGSGDSTARIWDVTDSEKASTSNEELCQRSIVLKHCVNSGDASATNTNKDVTSIDWDCTGKLLATGCYDGYARLWTIRGELLGTLGGHKGPIFALKWNETGKYILSAGVDKTTIIWDSSSRSPMQTFCHHTSSALDVDWISEDTFASCSTDMKIHVCRLHAAAPLRTYEGHTNEVNAIRYDRHSRRLASCSDDRTLKVWSLEQDRPLIDVEAHAKEIYTIRWSPVGHVLASASFDHTVKIWDVEQKKEVRQLRGHTDPVYSVSFSPEGRHIASGSFDRSVHIWDLKSGKIVLSYTGGRTDGGIFEVNWNRTGEKLAASTADGSVHVLDVRMVGAGRAFTDIRP